MKTIINCHSREGGKQRSAVANPLIYILLFLSFAFTACNSGDDDTEEWHQINYDAYIEYTKNPAYTELKTVTGPSDVYYKVLESGDGTEHPIQTATVKVLYKGMYYDGTVFDLGSSQNDIPVSFGVASTVRGFSFALQNMVVGDRWEIVIPYYLGYGTYSTSAVKAYSTLVFEVKLVDFNNYP